MEVLSGHMLVLWFSHLFVKTQDLNFERVAQLPWPSSLRIRTFSKLKRLRTHTHHRCMDKRRIRNTFMSEWPLSSN